MNTPYLYPIIILSQIYNKVKQIYINYCFGNFFQ
nr:MAG TPA: hypothetical protein [Caudoviricetes sp.]